MWQATATANAGAAIAGSDRMKMVGDCLFFHECVFVR
jgi:hypothetical protein